MQTGKDLRNLMPCLTGLPPGTAPMSQSRPCVRLELRDRKPHIRYCEKRRPPTVMAIEITSPDVEALIQQRMRTGAFKSPESLIRAACSVRARYVLLLRSNERP